MQRQVFISHAAEDEDWLPDDVEAVAEAIRGTGITVHLDLWLQRERKRKLSLDEWRTWMDATLLQSTHVLCLVSPRYQHLWQRKTDEASGFGVAFEAIRLIHALYLRKQRSNGRILTLRRDASDHDCIPSDLILDCPEYRWVTERELLLSHLAYADLPASVMSQGKSASPAPISTVPANTELENRTALEVALPIISALVPPLAPVVLLARKLQPTPAPSSATLLSLPAQPKRPGPGWASASGRDEYGHWADLTINGETQRMRWIPPTGPEGFWMGSTVAERAAIQDKNVRDWANKSEHAPRREHVRMGFWLADTPCTQAFWRALADIDPSHFSIGSDAPQRPVENVSWDAVMEQFIARLAARPGWAQGETVCLPSEVEWEYAARAGTRTAYWWGDTWDAQRGNADVTGKRGWDDAEGTTSVKSYGPNPWGLFDVHGNVWEWCEDAWCERRDAPETRPDVDRRVVRGGSWFDPPADARAAYRYGVYRMDADQLLGFRFALRSPVGPEAH